MSWGEAVRLVELLSADPSSAIAAALAEWAHPIPREAIVLMDLYDLQHASKSKRKPKPYPRPWARPARRSWGRTSMARDELVAALARHRTEDRRGGE